jgi:hypothetical protein
MRLDLILQMERPQTVIQKNFEEEYRNLRFAVSREKGESVKEEEA